MIHYDHQNIKPALKERPITVYEPLHLDYRDSPSLGSPKTSKNDLRSLDSLPTDSPQHSRNDLRSLEPEFRSLDSPKLKSDYFQNLDSPRLVSGIRNLHLDESSQMDESGYYSPSEAASGRRPVRSKSGALGGEFCDQHFDSFEAGGVADVSSGGTTPEPVCKCVFWNLIDSRSVTLIPSVIKGWISS